MSDYDVGDIELMKSRVNSRMCDTCAFRKGVMSPDSLREIIGFRLRKGTFLPCHSTHPPLAPQGWTKAAICRGFFNGHHNVGVLKVMKQLWGFVFVDPPKEHDVAEEDSGSADGFREDSHTEVSEVPRRARR